MRVFLLWKSLREHGSTTVFFHKGARINLLRREEVGHESTPPKAILWRLISQWIFLKEHIQLTAGERWKPQRMWHRRNHLYWGASAHYGLDLRCPPELSCSQKWAQQLNIWSESEAMSKEGGHGGVIWYGLCLTLALPPLSAPGCHDISSFLPCVLPPCLSCLGTSQPWTTPGANIHLSSPVSHWPRKWLGQYGLCASSELHVLEAWPPA